MSGACEAGLSAAYGRLEFNSIIAKYAHLDTDGTKSVFIYLFIFQC